MTRIANKGNKKHAYPLKLETSRERKKHGKQGKNSSSSEKKGKTDLTVHVQNYHFTSNKPMVLSETPKRLQTRLKNSKKTSKSPVFPFTVLENRKILG